MSALTLGPLCEKKPMSDAEQLGQKLMKYFPLIFCQTLIQSSSDRPPPGADGSGCRDPQLDIMRKHANLEIYIEVHHI